MAAQYQKPHWVIAPCGHGHGGDQLGAKRGRASTDVPPTETVVSECFCGAVYTIAIKPILLVVGYEAEILETSA